MMRFDCLQELAPGDRGRLLDGRSQVRNLCWLPGQLSAMLCSILGKTRRMTSHGTCLALFYLNNLSAFVPYMINLACPLASCMILKPPCAPAGSLWSSSSSAQSARSTSGQWLQRRRLRLSPPSATQFFGHGALTTS